MSGPSGVPMRKQKTKRGKTVQAYRILKDIERQSRKPDRDGLGDPIGGDQAFSLDIHIPSGCLSGPLLRFDEHHVVLVVTDPCSAESREVYVPTDKILAISPEWI
jgi:hypothetical protein